MERKFYSVAIRKRDNADDRFFLHEDYKFVEVKINVGERYWIADPFLFEKNGKVYLFYELFDLIKQKGYIAYSILKENYTATSPEIIIKDVCHLSFPNIFEYNGKIYVMPESGQIDSVKLFVAKKFPDVWVEDKTLVKNTYSCDSIFLNFANENYLLCSEHYRYPSEEKLISCYVKNKLYKIVDDHVCEGEIVAKGDYGIRNAGKTFSFNNKVIRPGQNCANRKYGFGLCFFEINNVSPYSEKEIFSVNCTEMQSHISFAQNEKKIIGTHTYNSSDNYEIIDFSYYSDEKEIIRLTRDYVEDTLKALKRKFKGYYKRAKRKIPQIIMNYDEKSYKSVIDEKKPWVLVSYIAKPFYHKDDEEYLCSHQNVRETLAMAEIINNLGYNALFVDYLETKELPDIDCRLIFGHDPGFSLACEKYPNAKKIYYAVSTYYEYRNQKIKEMTDCLNVTFNVKMPYRRLVEPHKGPRISDGILLRGSDITVETYPSELRSKITKICKSTQNCKYVNSVEYVGNNEFLFLASSGNALKGVCPIIEYFRLHPELTLHWIGSVEYELQSVLDKIITPNINVYGFQNVNSNLVAGLMERCDFIVYPSGVEGGAPGALLVAMKSGLIPLVSKYAAFDEIDDYGYAMENTDVESISKAVEWARSLSPEDILDKKKACSEFVLKNYNLEVFKKEFKEYFSKYI